jgi:hypothetical protein
MTIDPQAYFPADYRQGRRNFIAACQKRGLDSIARVHPSAKGPDGKPLFIDSVALGPRDAGKAVLLIAGTHGVEGYFGSAAETGLLAEGLTPPPDCRLVMVHALNPYGFAWDRRVNEDNVDLNRNFVDHRSPPDNPAYALLADAIAYRDARPEAIAQADARLAAYAENHGPAALRDAICRGQYRFPKGLHFGGVAESWSHKMLRAVLTEDLARVEKLVVIDFHTGLGPLGQGEMIVETGADSSAYRRAQAIWGALVTSSENGDAVCRPLTGTLDQAMEAWMADRELTFAALEVGTLPFETMFNALRRDNWFYNFSQDQRLKDEIRAQCRAAFFPDRPDWKKAVFAHAQKAVRAALAAL